MHVQLILIICRFHIWRFGYSLRFVLCTPEVILTVFSWSFVDMHRAAKNRSPDACVPSQDWMKISYISSYAVNKSRFWGLLCVLFSALLDGGFALQSCPEFSVEVLSSDPSAGSLFCAIWRKCMLNKLRSGMSCSAVGSEFNVNEAKRQYI